MDPFIAQIILFAGNFAPRGWAFCDGALMPISANTTLFSILGTAYGGNGRDTFALPDLRGRVPVHAGHGLGLSNYRLGSAAGAETHTMSVAELPKHQHGFQQPCSDVQPTPSGASDNPVNKVLAQAEEDIYGDPTASSFLSPGITEYFGQSVPFNIRQPSLALNFIIALQGTFPSRS